MTATARNIDPPLYQQVKDHIIDQVVAGDWTAGDRIPSEHELTDSMKVSRMTVHRALRELTAEGWLTRVQGAGTFVAEAKPQSALLEIHNIRDEIAERGREHRCAVITLESIKASVDVARALEINAGDTVYHSVLVHKENGTPLQVEERHVNPAFASEYLRQDFSKITPYEYLIQIGPMDVAEHMIEAIPANQTARRLLAIAADEPCLVVTRRTWSDGLVVSRARLTHPGSRYKLIGRQDYPQTTGSQLTGAQSIGEPA